jgi:hypothetical protein
MPIQWARAENDYLEGCQLFFTLVLPDVMRLTVHRNAVLYLLPATIAN